MTFKEKYLGDKRFYTMLIALVLPIVIQQGITNFVNLLDNLMVGRLGTIHMSGVSIVNQLIFIFNLSIFGGLSGASIFGTQFYGVQDWRGMRDTFRFKFIFSVATSVLAMLLFIFYGDNLILLFLENDENSAADIAATLVEAKAYFRIAIFGLLPFAIVQVYAGTLREMGETLPPMIGGCIAIVINLVFNYLLIYGKFGFPQLGVAGAALATVLSRFVELIYIVLVTHSHSEKYRFIKGVYKSISIPRELVRRIIITGTPLLVNEVLWSVGTTFINQNYSIRGIGVVAATNITGTAWNLFCVIMFAMGSAVSILVGQKLGAGDREGAIDIDRKLLFITFVSHVVIGALVIAFATFIPLLYNVEPQVQHMATRLLMIAGAALPIHAVIHVAYFTIRSGGKTMITFLFDSAYTWAIPVVLSFILCRFTSLDILWIYFIVQFSDIIKLSIAIPMLKSGFWANCVIKNVGEGESV